MARSIDKVEIKLKKAQQKKLIVQFSRVFESGTFTGYIMDIGPDFFTLASLNDGFEFDNYSCLRIKDVRKLQCPAKYEAFYIAARKLRSDKFPRKIKLDLSDQLSILHSAAPSLVTIHREKINPDACHIGYGLADNGKKWKF